MNASTNEVTVACGQYRSHPDPLTLQSADAPADVSLIAGGAAGIASFRCDRATPPLGSSGPAALDFQPGRRRRTLPGQAKISPAVTAS
jgi:hypothetical protein